MSTSETPEELGARIATLYRELSYPSAARFQAALRKRGIKVSQDFVRELVAEQGERQLTQAPPQFTGHVTAQRIDERWAADVLDFQSKRIKSPFVWCVVVQDIFSRFLFALAVSSKAEVGAAFLRIMSDSGRQ